MDATYSNLLKSYLQNPSSFTGSPGFQFALDSGLDAVNRKGAAGGFANSGNILAELTKYGTGLATQDYGNTIDRLGKLSGQEQQFQLGSDQNANTATRNANDFSLGEASNALRGQNDWWNYDVNKEQNANTASRNWNDFNLASDRNGIDWYNAATNRGTAKSGDYYRGQGNQLDWEKFYRGGR